MTPADLLGDRYEQHCRACVACQPPRQALGFHAWLLAYVRRELATMRAEWRGRMAALEAEWQRVDGDGR